jgi:thymidylate synthase
MIFKDMFTKVMMYGNKVAPRGLEIIEIENFSYTLPSYVRFMNYPDRKLNLNYIKKEFLWYLHGNKFDTSIAEHASIWKNLINDDGSINSNYGQYVFGEIKQFEYVYRTLANDKDSRRASIMILSKDHLLSDTKDIPCTYAINFRIRNNTLNMTVHMRSQDAIFGAGNDIPAFSFIHEMMYNYLKLVYPDIQYGTYHHVVDSFHIYKKHYQMVDNILKGQENMPIECPKISGPEEVHNLLNLEFDNVPEKYQFTRWLLHQQLFN